VNTRPVFDSVIVTVPIILAVPVGETRDIGACSLSVDWAPAVPATMASALASRTLVALECIIVSFQVGE